MRWLQTRLDWPFPLETTHDGIPLGNGLLGAFLWGGRNLLQVTINRSDYWEHRGGKPFGQKLNYENTLRFLQAGDYKGLDEFYNSRLPDDVPWAPTRLAMGRFDISFDPGHEILSGGLKFKHAEAELNTPNGVTRAIIIRSKPVLAIRFPQTQRFKIKPHPADAEDILNYCKKYGYPDPKLIEEDNFCAWIQVRPNNEPVLCAACLISNNEVFIAPVYGSDSDHALREAKKLLQECAALGFANLADSHRHWWEDYWKKTPQIDIPDQDISLLYYLGMYKLAGMAAPGTPPAGLQGVWVEDYCIPPWQCDYHFNINVQECYWPAYAGNHLDWLPPLFEMLWSWMPILRQNAKTFLGIDDGIMLLHATDDLCQRQWDAWQGVIDFACASWLGHMMWQYYRYSLDEKFLRESAYPFMKAALRTYQAQLEDDGTRYHLPMSVNPEIYDDSSTMWGRNGSFQLANIHAMCEALISASTILNVDQADRARWQDIKNRLPVASIGDHGLGEEILIWDGRPLPHSHRHHSHLAGIYPFDIFDFGPDGPHEQIVDAGIKRWSRLGMGEWTGWCVPWASILWSRRQNGQMAKLCLDIVRRFFIRPGFASTHDAMYPGFTMYDSRRKIMQLDAIMGSAAAVMEMLCHTRRGVLHIFPAMPPAWAQACFKGVRAEGGFLVDAVFEKRKVSRVEILSEHGQTLKIANPFGQAMSVLRDGKPAESMTGAIVEIKTTKGEKINLLP